MMSNYLFSSCLSNLGGGQHDTNMFPDVDSSWKVCIPLLSVIATMHWLFLSTMFFSCKDLFKLSVLV